MIDLTPEYLMNSIREAINKNADKLIFVKKGEIPMIKTEFPTFRPCLILPKKVKGFCHGIFQDFYTVAPTAIVEVEGGHVIKVDPIQIKFLDSKFDEYDFRDEENIDGNQTEKSNDHA